MNKHSLLPKATKRVTDAKVDAKMGAASAGRIEQGSVIAIPLCATVVALMTVTLI